MDITWYIPNKLNFENERYSTFKALINARPDVIKKDTDMKLSAYHTE
jgi:hypothetical protein